MNISGIKYTPNFGRALTTKEKEAYKCLISDAKDQLELRDTSAIIFDFNVPSEKNKNTAIGTTWSESMQKFTRFIKDMTGITSIQLQPQGKIVPDNTSPYSGTNYAYGYHIIDLEKLTQDEYGNILTLKDITDLDKEYNGDKSQREYKTDYSYMFSVQKSTLKKAFRNFKNELSKENPKAIELSKEFDKFKQKNHSWLEKDTLFEALSFHYNTDNYTQWNKTDKDLFASTVKESDREKRINQIKKEFSETIEFESFIQFVADKQQKECRKNINELDIKLYGDCLIGFSQSEIWSNPECFHKNLYYGGPDPDCPETNYIQTWRLNAPDYRKLGECSDDGDLSGLGEVGKFLYEKYSNFFKRYDGLRLDAAWQFITPFIYAETSGSFEEVKLPEINFTIYNIMKAAAKNTLKDKFDENNPENIMLELVGTSADKSRKLTMNIYPHLYTTAYAEFNERPRKFLEKGYLNGNFYTGVGCHDNDSLVNMAKYEKSELHMNNIMSDFKINDSIFEYETDEYKNQDSETKKRENFRTAKFAEIFTVAKQFFTLPDLFGMPQRINLSGKTHPDNWSVRIPSDYERFYFSQLSKGLGLNIPKTYAAAMKMKHINNEYLINKSEELSKILRQKGPLTEAEANLAAKEGNLEKEFYYSSNKRKIANTDNSCNFQV